MLTVPIFGWICVRWLCLPITVGTMLMQLVSMAASPLPWRSLFRRISVAHGFSARFSNRYALAVSANHESS